MIHIISENFLWKVKSMTKQTKIIISVVLFCTILLAIAIPSFASEYTGVFTQKCVNPPNPSHYFDIPNIADGTTLTYPFNPSSYWNFTIDDSVLSIDVNSISILFEKDSNDPSRLYSFTVAFNGIAYESATPEGEGVEYSIPAYVSSIDIGTDSTVGTGSWLYDVQAPTTINTIEIEGDDAFLSWFSAWYDFPTSTPIPDNPFSYIFDMVIASLDIPIFGGFSLWDMITTVCGMFAVIWLLKLLSGG